MFDVRKRHVLSRGNVLRVSELVRIMLSWSRNISVQYDLRVWTILGRNVVLDVRYVVRDVHGRERERVHVVPDWIHPLRDGRLVGRSMRS